MGAEEGDGLRGKGEEGERPRAERGAGGRGC